MPHRNSTRAVHIGGIVIGDNHPIAVQSMCATHTTDIDATVQQVTQLSEAGAGIVRIAVDNKKDVAALREIRNQTSAVLSVDLQENFRLAASVAPHVDKIRYNPGHLYHHEKNRGIERKVEYLVDVARDNDCAMRIGVNCGSVDPELLKQYPKSDSVSPMVASALQHCELVEAGNFDRFCVSLKDSDPQLVIEANRRFARQRPDIPLHLGVTEAGMPPQGVIKSRLAFQAILSEGIGDTVRVSLTLPNHRKHEEVEAGLFILEQVERGNLLAETELNPNELNIISCPSCSRVENETFVELAQQVREQTRHAKDRGITIAVMGCRVNGPGETDDADLGLWCGPRSVNLKRKGTRLGAFSYQDIMPKLLEELDKLL